jgi:Phytochelatin synthase
MSAEEFREHLKGSNDPAHRYILNFDRKMIFGAGGGHQSPIGGYLENEDLFSCWTSIAITVLGLWSARACSMQ